MAHSMLAVIQDLDEHVDETDTLGSRAPRLHVARRTVCVSGKGPFDDTVSAMLVQLLKQRGCPSRTIPNSAASRDAIGGLDLDGVEVIALSYLEPWASPAHLRYLIKRLRQQAPRADIIVGLWPRREGVPDEAKLRTAIGADHHAGSLRDALSIILSAPHPVDGNIRCEAAWT